MILHKLAPGTNPPYVAPPCAFHTAACSGKVGRRVLRRKRRWNGGGDSEVELNRKVCAVNGTMVWRCIEGYGVSLTTERAPSPNLLKLPAHTVGPPPTPRCEHRRSNTPENQSAHPLGDAHASVLWWSDSSDGLCERRREGFFHVRWRKRRTL